MEKSHHHHHHHHHHHGHKTTQDESNSNNQQAENVVTTSKQQQVAVQSVTAPILVPRPNEQTSGGVQATSSFHSVSSIDSSAEMAKYFPEAETSTLSSFPGHHQEDGGQQTQSAVISTTTTAANNAAPYATVPAPTVVQQQFPQPARGSQVQAPAAPKLPSGIPGYSSQVEGLSVSQTVVNDVIIDLQSKILNETQQQYYNDSSIGSYFEPLAPIYIRAPDPSIILRSDLHRLRAQLTVRPPVVVRHPGNINQFQIPSFPPPQ